MMRTYDSGHQFPPCASKWRKNGFAFPLVPPRTPESDRLPAPNGGRATGPGATGYGRAATGAGAIVNSDASHRLGAPQAALRWGRDGSPVSADFEDIYYSRENGLAETDHVFLRGNRLRERWRRLDASRFTIAETGFGTGLNFLAAWRLWRECDPARALLHFLSVEKYPLSRTDLARSLANWPALGELSEQLLEQYPPPLPGMHRQHFANGTVVLDLLLGDAEDALRQVADIQSLTVDAWFLDGFSPAKNPDMWTHGLFRTMARLSRPGASLATFTAAGTVRRGLRAAGFRVEKREGFGSKRDMLVGELRGRPAPESPRRTPWHRLPESAVAEKSAVILGAGLAGATLAASLDRRHWSVTVVEAGEIAGGASGNAQGVLYTRISRRPSDLDDYSLHSYCYALRYYRALVGRGLLRAGEDLDFCGALHLVEGLDSDHPLTATLASLPGLAYPVETARAATLSGLKGCPGGLFFPGAGWVRPPAVCRALLSASDIRVRDEVGPTTLEREDGYWVVRAARQREIARAPVAAIACGAASRSFGQTNWLPLQSIRGQVTQLPSRGALKGLKTVICHDGYLPPAAGGSHWIGASFDSADGDTRPRDRDHADNLGKLSGALAVLASDLAHIDPRSLRGRVGFRAASPDRLPLVGPAPDFDAFREVYAPLRKDAGRVLDVPPPHIPGLFLTTGHGSRGLTSVPLAAELLASQICSEPWPLGSDLCRALAPARFIVRDLIRNRP